jgi:hypothetical protein
LNTKLTANKVPNISNDTKSPIQKPRKLFLSWLLPKGMMNASDDELEGASSSFEFLGWIFAAFVVAAVIAEVIIAAVHPPYDSNLWRWGSAITDFWIALGIVGEVVAGRMDARVQTELRNRSNTKLSEAIERAAKADLARTELEAQLSPRMLNQRQWDLIQSFKGQFSAVNVGYETDAEARWFAVELQTAFMSAGIKGVTLARDPTVHSFSVMIFEPNGFDGSRPKTVSPLVELFKAEDQLKHGTAAIIGGVPTDILRQAGDDEEARAFLNNTPMIIVGGRFIVPPAHWPKPAKTAPPRAPKTDTANT